MPASCPSPFLELFTVRRDCCRTLLELSEQQPELIATDQYTQLLEVLHQKQRVLGRLDQWDAAHPELWPQWKQQRDTLPDGLRDDCEALLAESESLLAELLAREKSGTEALTQRRNETSEALKQVAEGVQVHQAYRDHATSPTHHYLDVGQ